MYCTADDVYEATSLSATEVAEANVNAFILAAEKMVDRTTFTTYWNVEQNGTASSGGATTLVQTGAGWTNDAYNDMWVWVYGGTGIGQMRKITDTTTDTLTVDTAWDTNPDDTSTFRVIYAATEPYFDEDVDGDGTDTYYLDEYPLQILESLSINSTSITTTNVYQYKKIGKIVLSNDAEKGNFDDNKPQLVDMTYWWGVYPLPYEVKRYVIVCASINTLSAQMGGTFNVPSTYSLPEGSVTVGQAYINIKSTWDTLMKEKEALELILIKYPRIL